MPRKLTYKFVKQDFIKNGFVPKFTDYINNSTKLDYICPKGHKHSISWANWRQGKRCPYCVKLAKPTIEEVKQEFIQRGCIPKFTEYINNRQKLDYICPNGHNHSINWSSFNSGGGCQHCARNVKLTTEFVKSQFEKENCITKFTEYKNNRQKLDYICSNGHEHSITWHNWDHGKRCPKCSNRLKLFFEKINQEFIKKGCTPKFTEYINSRTKLDYICPNGHEHSIRWDGFNSDYGCPKCSEWGTSKFEQEVKDFIISLNKKIIENDRTIIKGEKGWFLELDILFTCKTKAIECNGIYWHDRPEAIEKDKIKNKQCKEKGIKLLTITDAMWYNDREKCEKLIKKLIEEN